METNIRNDKLYIIKLKVKKLVECNYGLNQM